MAGFWEAEEKLTREMNEAIEVLAHLAAVLLR